MMKESLPRVYSSDEELFTPIDHETPDLLEDHRLEPYRGQKHVGGNKALPPADSVGPANIAVPQDQQEVLEKAMPWNDAPGVIPDKSLVVIDRMIDVIVREQNGGEPNRRRQWFF